MNSMPIHGGLYLKMNLMESFEVINPNPSSSQSALSTSYRMILCHDFVSQSVLGPYIYPIDIFLASRMSFMFYMNVQKVLQSEPYCCLDSILVGCPCLAPVYLSFSLRIHSSEEHLVPLDGGCNVFSLGFTWQHVVCMQSKLIT